MIQCLNIMQTKTIVAQQTAFRQTMALTQLVIIAALIGAALLMENAGWIMLENARQQRITIPAIN